MKFWQLLQAKHAHARKVMILRDKRQQERRDRPEVGGIQKEITRTHHQILWIGGFENQQTSWLQHPQRLNYERIEFLEGNMLGNVKTRDNT